MTAPVRSVSNATLVLGRWSRRAPASGIRLTAARPLVKSRRRVVPANRRSPRPAPGRGSDGTDPLGGSRLQRLQVLDQLGDLLGGQLQLEMRIVVLDDVRQGREAAVVVEAPLRPRPQPLQRRRAVALVR